MYTIREYLLFFFFFLAKLMQYDYQARLTMVIRQLAGGYDVSDRVGLRTAAGKDERQIIF